MKRYFCSAYVKKNNVSDEANNCIARDLALFSAMKFDCFSISNRTPKKDNKEVFTGAPHTYLKNKYSVNDYFVTAVEGSVRMARSSQKELLKLYAGDTKEDIKALEKKIKDLDDRLSLLKRMKDSLILYTKDGGRKLSMIKNFKSSGISFKPDKTVVVGFGKNRQVYPNIWLFEHAYLDQKIRQIKRAISSVRNRLRRKKDKLTKIREQMETGYYSIYFGSRELMHKEMPKSQKDKLIKKKRKGSMTLSGRHDATSGNFMVIYDPDTHQLSYRGSAGACRQKGVRPKDYFVAVGKIGFAYGQDIIDNVIRQGKAPVSWTITDCGNAWRFDVCVTLGDDRKNDYYGNGCIAMDINWDRIAVAELDGEGSLLGRKVIPFTMEGRTTQQIEHRISEALEEVFKICRRKKKPLAAEDISKVKRKAGLYSTASKRNRRISMFASTKIRQLTESKSYKYDTDVTFINPAYTSQTGKVKYMQRYGMSIHESAAFVIGRRGLGIMDRLPEIYREKLSNRQSSLPRLDQWTKAYKYTRAVKAADMYLVDELPF